VGEKEIHISSRKIGILPRRIGISLAEIPIFPRKIHKWEGEIPISLSHLCISVGFGSWSPKRKRTRSVSEGQHHGSLRAYLKSPLWGKVARGPAVKTAGNARQSRPTPTGSPTSVGRFRPVLPAVLTAGPRAKPLFKQLLRNNAKAEEVALAHASGSFPPWSRCPLKQG